MNHYGVPQVPKVELVSCQTNMAPFSLYAPTISAADVGHVSVTFLWCRSMYDATTTSERYPSPWVNSKPSLHLMRLRISHHKSPVCGSQTQVNASPVPRCMYKTCKQSAQSQKATPPVCQSAIVQTRNNLAPYCAIKSSEGKLMFSSACAYGVGTSAPVIRTAGASR